MNDTEAMDSRVVPPELRHRSHRPAVALGVLGLDIDKEFWGIRAEHEGAWHESEDAIVSGLLDGERKRRLLGWVRAAMSKHLTPHQRECVELFYFLGLNCREIAAIRGINKSTAYRNKQRGIGRLRAVWDARDCPACIIEAAMLYTGRKKESDHGESTVCVHHAQSPRGILPRLPLRES